MSTWINALFRPRRIALVGASESTGKAGKLLMDNLLAHTEKGSREVVPVHPKAATVCGLPAFRSVSAIPGKVDLAVLVVPAADAPGVIADCGRAGVTAAVIISGGFAETGSQGRGLEVDLLNQATAGGVRLLGPNCFGVIETTTLLNASIAQTVPQPGGVSLITQSGAYGMATLTRSREDGIGFAKIVALGNACDLDETDLLEAMGRDEQTLVVGMLLESIRGGRQFCKVLAEVCARKPVVVLKTGRSRDAQRAAQSHTAALSNDSRLVEDALRQAGAHVVEDGLTLLDVADSLVRQPRLRGNRVAIVTNSGGTGVELTDLLESRGLEVPELSEDLQATIRAVRPPHGSATNPIDVTTDWARFPVMHEAALTALLESDEIDAIVPVLLQRSALMPEVAERVAAVARAAAAAGSVIPIHVCWVAPREADNNRRLLISAGLPCHPWPERTARVLAGCMAPEPALMPLPVHQPVERTGEHSASGWLPSAEVFTRLEQAGLPVVPWRLGRDGVEVCHKAEEIGFPVVLKAERPGLLHKSDSGAVRLNVPNSITTTEVVADFETRFGPGPTLLQRQVGQGVELVIGSRRDEQFGPVILTGLGGVWIEALADVALRLAPVSQSEAVAMIEGLRGRTLLDGYRGLPVVDIEVFAALIADISHWFAMTPDLAELDLNPIIATADGLWIVDARLRLLADGQDPVRGES